MRVSLHTIMTSELELVLIESPYASGWTEDIEKNANYLRAAMADCFKKKEAPFASHGLYTQPGVLNDQVPEERKLGIEAGLLWGNKASKTVVYIDRGISSGMKVGIERAKAEGRGIEFRTLGSEWVVPETAPSTFKFLTEWLGLCL